MVLLVYTRSIHVSYFAIATRWVRTVGARFRVNRLLYTRLTALACLFFPPRLSDLPNHFVDIVDRFVAEHGERHFDWILDFENENLCDVIGALERELGFEISLQNASNSITSEKKLVCRKCHLSHEGYARRDA